MITTITIMTMVITMNMAKTAGLIAATTIMIIMVMRITITTAMIITSMAKIAAPIAAMIMVV
jgi:hypothetical protein